MTIQVVILAAGQGKRMYSQHPKVLHHLAGKPLLEHVIQTVNTLSSNTKPIVIFGHQGEKIQNKFTHHHLQWVEQKEQLGTAHAVMQALPHISDEKKVLVLCGDVPLISELILQKLIQETPDDALGILTANVTNPFGYGRILRDNKKNITSIIEEKDANEEQKKITEINPGIYLVPAKFLKKWLPLLNNKNHQKEYYLTDIISHAVKDGVPIHSVSVETTEEILGVNDKLQLATLERFYQRQQAEKFLRQGVTIYDPQRFDVRGNIKIGRDVVIDVNVILEEDVVIGDDCVIGANSILRNVEIGNRVVIKPNTLIDGAVIACDCVIGPFARIRPETILAEHVHIGNFVEVKKSSVNQQTKISHLSYIGDSQIGKQVNIGAGTITCNYDGVNKHCTRIGDNVFIGSGTELVAPVKINDGATIGAGSTITQDAPANTLTLARTRQQSVEGWRRPEKKEK